MHKSEHGFGGGLELGVGDVADDGGFADGSGEDEGAGAAALLFVAVGEGYEGGGTGFEGGDGAVAEDQIAHAGVLGGGDGLAGEGYVKGGDGAPGYGFAVEELLVAGGGFDGVADGVAEVEDHAEAVLFFVLTDDVGFDADGGGYDFGEGGGVAGEDEVGVLFHVGEEAWVVDDAGLDGLLEAGAEFGGGQGAEKVGVGEDGERMVEAADEILAGGEVGAGFAAEGGVDLGEEGGRDLNVGDAAHVDGGEESGEVADDAATEGEEEGVAVGPGGGELLGEGFERAEAFVGFACGDEEDGGGFFKRREKRFLPEGPDLGGGDDEGAVGRSAAEFAQAGAEGAEEA